MIKAIKEAENVIKAGMQQKAEVIFSCLAYILIFQKNKTKSF